MWRSPSKLLVGTVCGNECLRALTSEFPNGNGPDPFATVSARSKASIGRYSGGSIGSWPLCVVKLSISSRRLSKNCMEGRVYSPGFPGSASSFAASCNRKGNKYNAFKRGKM